MLIRRHPPKNLARSHTGFSVGRRFHLHPQPVVGAKLARDSGGSASGDVGCAAAIASKLAPTLGSRLAADFTSTRNPLWEQSLLAIAVDQLVVMLAVPPPSRASSLPHWVLGWPQISHPPPIPCGSELARDSGGSASGDVGCAAAFASKPAPTLGSRLAADFTSTRNPLWEQSLLAIAVDQLVVMLAVPPPSRASPLPHWVLGWPQISHPPATRCGSKACSR